VSLVIALFARAHTTSYLLSIATVCILHHFWNIAIAILCSSSLEGHSRSSAISSFVR